jgi:hypothetical protein
MFILIAGTAPAQSLRVVSEFQRVDPFGEVVPVDRTPRPREILSPAVARNAFASFHVVVTAPEREPFLLYVQTNPRDAFRISLYEELYSRAGDGWIPDALEPVKLPAFNSLPYVPLPIPGQNTLSYWLDIWVPAEATVERVRVEVLLKSGPGWVMYPMEVRVTPASAPSVEQRHAVLPPITARADASVLGPLRNFLCNAREPGRDERLSVRRLIHRNALQDLALARMLEDRKGVDVRAGLLRRASVEQLGSWCKSPLGHAEGETEWFLHVRDWLYRQAGPAPD